MSKPSKKRVIIQVALRPEDAEVLKKIIDKMDISASAYTRSVLLADLNIYRVKEEKLNS